MFPRPKFYCPPPPVPKIPIPSCPYGIDPKEWARRMFEQRYADLEAQEEYDRLVEEYRKAR